MEHKTPSEYAKILIQRYQKDKLIEHTPYAGANTEYTSLNEREAASVSITLCYMAIEEIELIGRSTSSLSPYDVRYLVGRKKFYIKVIDELKTFI